MKTLTAIGLQSDNNYLEVKQTLESFVEINTGQIEGVNFINSFLDDFERSFYFQKNSSLNIGELLKKIDKILA